MFSLRVASDFCTVCGVVFQPSQLVEDQGPSQEPKFFEGSSQDAPWFSGKWVYLHYDRFLSLIYRVVFQYFTEPWSYGRKSSMGKQQFLVVEWSPMIKGILAAPAKATAPVIRG